MKRIRGWFGELLVLSITTVCSASAVHAQEIDWVREIESRFPGGEAVRGIGTDGDVYVVGTAGGSLSGTPGAGGGTFVRRYDQAGQEVWTVELGSSIDLSPAALAVDAAAVYIAGSVRQGSDYQVLVRKYDLDGNEIWTRIFGTAGWDFASDLAVGPTGVYVVGTVLAALPGQTLEGSSDVFVRKYATDGDELWTRQFGTVEADDFGVVSVSTAGVFVGGRTRGTLPGQTRFGFHTGFPDAFVRLYDVDGNLGWTHQYGAPLFGANPADLAADAGGVYVCGSTAGTLPGQPSSALADAYVRRYDTLGQEAWTRQFGTADSDIALSIASDGAGALVVGDAGQLPGQATDGSFVRRYDALGNEVWSRQDGDFRQVTDVEVDGTSIYVAGNEGETVHGRVRQDARIERRDLAGDLQWVRVIATEVETPDSAQAADCDGNLYVGGFTDGELPGQSTSGIRDAFVLKLDPAGNEQWTRQFGSIHRDSLTGLATDLTGVYAVGQTEGTLPGQTTSGSWDVFLRKLDPLGGEEWLVQYGTPSTDDATGVAVNSSCVYVAGFTLGTFAGETSAGGRDAFLSCFDLTGAHLWTRQFGTAMDERAFAIAATDQEVAVAGYTYGGFPGFTNQGGVDAWIRAFEADGTERWTDQYGTGTTDSWEGLSFHDGVLYAGGRSVDAGTAGIVRAYDGNGAVLWSTFQGRSVYGIAADSGGVFVCGDVSLDSFAARLDHAGNEVWQLVFGTDRLDRARAITHCSSGLYVAGLTLGSFDQVPNVPGDSTAFAARIRPFDSDDDGLSDDDEVTIGTDPFDPDTDDDGLLDGAEVDAASGSGCPDPLDPDSDDDMLLDGEEVLVAGTDPCTDDSDGDGLCDLIDGDPTSPVVSPGALAESLYNLATQIESFELALFSGANAIVQSVRRNTIAGAIRRAAMLIDSGEVVAAAASLDLALGKLNDWMHPSPQRAVMSNCLDSVDQLLGN